jgi:prepilin-type processing-associated H-X9-DG protein
MKGGAKAPIMLDCALWAGDPMPTDSPPQAEAQAATDPTIGSNSIRPFCIPRHGGFVNCLFMDWSIRKVGIKELWTLEWYPGFDRRGPYRLGLPRGRTMTLQDYEVIVYISKAVGVRIKCPFVVSEFDRSNICAQYPTTNEQGIRWDYSALVTDNDFTIMDYVKQNSATVELEMYRTQEMRVKLLFEPHEVNSDNTDLDIQDWHYRAPFIYMLIHGQNIQGELGVIAIKGRPL